MMKPKLFALSLVGILNLVSLGAQAEDFSQAILASVEIRVPSNIPGEMRTLESIAITYSGKVMHTTESPDRRGVAVAQLSDDLLAKITKKVTDLKPAALIDQDPTGAVCNNAAVTTYK